MPCSRGSAPGGVPAPGGACSGGGVWRPPESRQLLLRTVRILLECILVLVYINATTQLEGIVRDLEGLIN